jgi:hypothetical protein
MPPIGGLPFMQVPQRFPSLPSVSPEMQVVPAPREVEEDAFDSHRRNLVHRTVPVGSAATEALVHPKPVHIAIAALRDVALGGAGV